MTPKPLCLPSQAGMTSCSDGDTQFRRRRLRALQVIATSSKHRSRRGMHAADERESGNSGMRRLRLGPCRGEIAGWRSIEMWASKTRCKREASDLMDESRDATIDRKPICLSAPQRVAIRDGDGTRSEAISYLGLHWRNLSRCGIFFFCDLAPLAELHTCGSPKEAQR